MKYKRTPEQMQAILEDTKRNLNIKITELQNANREKYAHHPFAHGFGWFTVELISNPKSGKTKCYKFCTSVNSINPMELCREAASIDARVKFTHHNMD